MDKRELRDLLGHGFSLAAIGQLYAKDHSTVGYWVRKHGLRAANHDRCAPRGGLDESLLKKLVADRLTTDEIAVATSRSASTVRYWLRRFGLKTCRGREPYPDDRPPRTHRLCRTHGRTEFILENRGYYRCTRCRAQGVSERRRRVKAILVREAGGRCEICGYSRYIGALQFHHVRPGEKAFAVSRAGVTRSLAASREEAAKCALLCANCHAEVEGGAANLPGRRKEEAVRGYYPI